MNRMIKNTVFILGSIFLISCASLENKEMNAEKALKDGKSCGSSPHGSSMTGYLQSSTPKGVSCPMATRTCVNGNWSGPELFNNCTERP